MPGSVVVRIDGPLAHVTLSHPGKLNAMSRAMWRELKAAFDGLQADASVRCVLVRGDGHAFCAGGDIAEYPGFRFDPASLADFHETDVWGGLAAMLACDVPIVAQVEGACMGAGVEIASCCDIRIASDRASFGAPIAKLGFPMAPKEAALVARAVGQATAREMLLEARVFDARQMLARGFLNDIVHAPDLADACAGRCARIASLAPQAARLNKQVLRALAEGREPQDPYGYAASGEHRAGIAAFLDKRSTKT
jgi:enoyl-CoA hydratase/carnithine racemase